MGLQKLTLCLLSTAFKSRTEIDGRHTLFHETVVIGASEKSLIRHRVRAQFKAMRISRQLDGFVKRRSFHTKGDEVGKIISDDRHIQVDDRDHAVTRYGRIAGEVVRTIKALFFSRQSD